VCARFGVEASVIGTVRPPDADGVGRLRVREGDGPLLAELPAATLADGAPRYRRPLRPWRAGGLDPDTLPPPADCGADLLRLLEDTSWVYSQYDHQLFCNTVLGPGEGDAALLRLAGPGVPATGRGIAVSSDANPGWCRLDPRRGSAATVAESVLNVACAGGRAVALVNCLNFGNPEHPEVMWQLSESIDGIAEACRALGVPVVGGNVSLYNEHDGRDIDPTPVVAVLGLLEALVARPPALSLVAGESLVLLGTGGGRLGGSRWARQLHAAEGGELFDLDLDLHARLVELVRGLVAAAAGGRAGGLVSGLHDVSDGGIAVAAAELALASGLGLRLGGVASHGELFGEAPSRVLACSPEPARLCALADEAGVPARTVGECGGRRLVVEGWCELSLEEMAAAGGRLAAALDGPLVAG